MRVKSSGRIGILLLLATAVGGWRNATDAVSLESRSRLWIAGTSTVRSFECKAGALNAEIDTVGDEPLAAILGGEKAVRSVRFTVPAAELDCGNDKMNDHMLKALKAAEFPEIRFRLSAYELERAEAGLRAALTGELTLGGETRPVTIASQVADGDGGVLRVAGSYELNMTDFGLKPPKLMLGTLRVHDKVTVGFELFLKN